MLSWPATGTTRRSVTTGVLACTAGLVCIFMVVVSQSSVGLAQGRRGLEVIGRDALGANAYEEDGNRRQHRGHRQAVQAALDRASLLLQQAEGGRRNEAAEVADRVDQGNPRRSDAGVQIALGDWPEQ
ncbi:hypothetical protein D3C71_1893160 [compost metagenome]